MTKYVVVASALIVMSLPTPAYSGSHEPLDEPTTQALNNFQQEVTECGVYFGLMAQCAKNRDRSSPSEAHRSRLAEDLAASERLANQLAVLVGLRIGLTEDAMVSRVDMSLADQKGLINANCMNSSSLIKRYALRCKKVLENADAVIQEYLQKERNR